MSVKYQCVYCTKRKKPKKVHWAIIFACLILEWQAFYLLYKKKKAEEGSLGIIFACLILEWHFYQEYLIEKHTHLL